MISKQLNPIRS